MASVRARKDNKLLFIDFRFKGKRYRRVTDKVDNRGNRMLVARMARAIEKSIKNGTFDPDLFFQEKGTPSNAVHQVEAQQEPALPVTPQPVMDCEAYRTPTFADFSEEWLGENLFRWKKSGKINMRNILNCHLIPEFGDRHLDTITKGDVLKFRAKLAQKKGRKAEKLSPKRINNIMQPLKAILDEAAERYGLEPVFQNIKPLQASKPDVKPFTLAEVMKIIDGVRKDYRNYFIVRFFTGMRSGEIHALTWKDIDFDRELICVSGSLTYGEISTTKTNKCRDIKMCGMVKEALLNQRRATQSISEFVFCNRQGNPLDNMNVANRIWYPLLRHLGLEARRPYQTRHTAASLWLSAGENPEWVARQLGHASTQMLFQTYSRYIPNATRKDGSAIENLLQHQMPSNTDTSNNHKEDAS